MEFLKIFFHIEIPSDYQGSANCEEKQDDISVCRCSCWYLWWDGNDRSVMPLLSLSGTAEAIREAPRMSVCCTRTCHPHPSADSAHPLSVSTQMASSSVSVNQCCPPGRLYVLAVNRCCVSSICVSVKPHSCNIWPENLNLWSSCK